MMINQTQKLIRCRVLNKYNEETIRYIEFESFQLWQHLMTSKHESKINDLILCLWVSAEEYEENENIYSHSGEIALVDNISVTLFDDEYGFTNTINRYVLNEETNQLSAILASHIPPEIQNTDLCDIQTYKGYAIEQNKHNPTRSMMLGLKK